MRQRVKRGVIMDFESQIEKIVKDIRDREDKELALAFTNVIGLLLRENGVAVKTSRYEFENDNESDKNKYIIKKEYGVSIDGLDFTEHDKVFVDKIASLEENVGYYKDSLSRVENNCDKLYHENKELKQRIAELENENKNLNIRIFQNEAYGDKKPTKLNLNEQVKVKLTPLGAEIYYHQYDELNKKIKENGGTQLEPIMPEIDKDGFTKFTLWHFMELYGEHIGMCKPNVIEPLDIVYCKHNKDREE